VTEKAETPLRLAVQTPHEQLRDVAVPLLEELLARARRGELDSLLVLFETADYDGMQWRTAGSMSRSQTMGRIEILKSRMMYDLIAAEEG
jgi:hypothetical protein